MTTGRNKLTLVIHGRNYFAGFIFVIEIDGQKFFTMKIFHGENFSIYCTTHLTTTVFLWCALGSGLPNGALPTNESIVTCSPNFYEENSTCFPICQTWSTDGTTGLVKLVTAAIASVLGILGGSAVIVGSVIRYKSMWVYVKLLCMY